MASGSTLVSSSPEKGMSTARTPWLAGGCTTSSLATVPPDPSSSDQAGEPCAPPPGEPGSPVSPLSSSAAIGGGITRVTSDPTSAVTMEITTITAAAAATVLATGQEDTTPSNEGHIAASLLPPPFAATRCRLGIHSSHMGGGRLPVSLAPGYCQTSAG